MSIVLSNEDLLSKNLFKHYYYNQDPHYREGLAIVKNMLNGDSFRDLLWNHSMLIIRPDAFWLGEPVLALPILVRHGLFPVAWREVKISGSAADSWWRYQANVMTPERIKLIRRLLKFDSSMLILLRDCSTRNCPSTVHLTYLKGPSLAVKREPWQLRAAVGANHGNILSYIHASDEPADMLREMCLLLGKRRMQKIIEKVSKLTPQHHLRFDELREYIILMTQKKHLPGKERNGEFRSIYNSAAKCTEYISGESYNPYQAYIPDAKELAFSMDKGLSRTSGLYGNP